MLATVSPFPQYFDLQGRPLDSGYLYFGAANDNPETNPVQVYWDAAGTQPAEQPIRTINGCAVRYGTPTQVFTAALDYSLTVRDAKRRLVVYAKESADFAAFASLGANLASPAVGKGSKLIAYMLRLTGAVARWVEDKLSESVSVFDFMTEAQIADVKAGTLTQDVTAALTAAFSCGRKKIYAPEGVYLFTSQLVVPNLVKVHGDGYGTVAGQAGTRFIKRGNFNGVVVNVGSQLENLSVEGDAGNGGDGIHVLGGRSSLRNVSSFGHGRDGIKVGDYAVSSANTNLWRIENAISRSNTRHGLFISHEGETTVPDANAGCLHGFEASFNGGDGLKVGEACENQLLGIACQNNTGYGVHFAQYARGNYLPKAYTENNTAGGTILDSGADENWVIGDRIALTNDQITDNGAGNYVVGKRGSITNLPLFKSPIAWFDLRFIEATTSGVWQIVKEATTRNLIIRLISTSATADVHIENTGGGFAGLRFSRGTNSAAIRALQGRVNVSLNFGTIPAQSSVDQTVTISGVDNTFMLKATPIFAIPAGVSWEAYWDSGASAVKVRCTNVTGAGIAVSGGFNVAAAQIV
jgi:hypothetical protein